jgi:hypothetical protein
MGMNPNMGMGMGGNFMAGPNVANSNVSRGGVGAIAGKGDPFASLGGGGGVVGGGGGMGMGYGGMPGKGPTANAAPAQVSLDPFSSFGGPSKGMAAAPMQQQQQQQQGMGGMGGFGFGPTAGGNPAATAAAADPFGGFGSPAPKQQQQGANFGMGGFGSPSPASNSDPFGGF